MVRSLRQGDPLASILYCVYIDPLHWALAKKGGYKMSGLGTEVASQGFMDDTATFANSFEQMLGSHLLVVDFSLLNDGKLNLKKSLLLLADHRGDGETRLLPTADGPIKPVAPLSNASHRYLGLWINLKLGWQAMDRKIKSNFWRCYYLINNNRFSLRACRLIIDLWLLPPMRHTLRLSRYADEKEAILLLGDLQKALNRLIARCMDLPHPKNWQGPICSVLLNLNDLRRHATDLNLEALHLRLNYPPEAFPCTATAHDRLAHLFNLPVVADPQAHSAMSLVSSSEQVLKRVERATLQLLTPSSTADNDTARKIKVALRHRLLWKFNPNHLFSRNFTPFCITQDEFWQLYDLPRGSGAFHPTMDLLRALFKKDRPAVWDLDPYEHNWLSEFVVAPAPLCPTSPIQVYTDGSSKQGEDSGAVAVFTYRKEILLTVRARLRPSSRNYLPECVGCLLAVNMVPINFPVEVICDCKSSLYVLSKPASKVAWRRRLTAAARPVVECARATLEIRTAPAYWRDTKSHMVIKPGDFDAEFNRIADLEAKEARGIHRNFRSRRVWSWGAEPSILCTWEYPSLTPQHYSAPHPAQVMGSLKSFLQRANRVELAKHAAKLGTMGEALRYNGEHILSLVKLLSSYASSKTHLVMAMALASYLPLQNRSNWTASKHPTASTCRICFSGLKQDSRHIFSCPARSKLQHSLFKGIKQGLSMLTRPLRQTPFVRPVNRSDHVRDCLITMEFGSLRQGVNISSFNTLSAKELSKIPFQLLRLTASWALMWGDAPAAHQWVGGCPVQAWGVWKQAILSEIELAKHMEHDPWNSAPPPSFWSLLHSAFFPQLFHAVVFDGSPTLGPSLDLVWYSADPLRAEEAWWALPLPDRGTNMRLFEWCPFISVCELESRIRWWDRAVLDSPESVFFALIPDSISLSSLGSGHALKLTLSSVFLIDVCQPKSGPRFWEHGPVTKVSVRTLLAQHIRTSTMSEEWASACRNLALHLRTSSLAVPRTPGYSHFATPASWWWGPTNWTTPHGSARARPHPRILFATAKCDGQGACQGLYHGPDEPKCFLRYFGNLGVAPLQVHEALGDRARAVFQGDRLPPKWVLHIWSVIPRILNSFYPAKSRKIRSC